MLEAIASGSDDEIATWARSAVDDEASVAAHVLDPVSLSILGVIFIGGILAARVRKVGAVEFYKGVPKELADVMKAGASVGVPKPG